MYIWKLLTGYGTPDVEVSQLEDDPIHTSFVTLLYGLAAHGTLGAGTARPNCGFYTVPAPRGGRPSQNVCVRACPCVAELKN